MSKQSLRFFDGKPVRAMWDYATNEWYYSAVDIVNTLTESKEPRKYWNVLKRRNPQLLSFCRKVKLMASDQKRYLSDVINAKGLHALIVLIPSKKREQIKSWINGRLDSLDEQSKRKAYELFSSNIIEPTEIGKSISLIKIHAFLFEGLYDFAGQIRELTISKDGFVFANGAHLPQTLANIDKMKDDSFESIINKYIEINIAHPFMDGNGRSARIWLDILLKERINKCVDWSKVDKTSYLLAMRKSPYNKGDLVSLIFEALTDKINDREVFMKGIDYSYYYEEADDSY